MSDPESGLILTHTFNSGDSISSTTGTPTTGRVTRDADAVFSCEILWPTNPTTGSIFEAGGTGQGTGVFYIAGSGLYFYAGDGGTSYTTTNSGRCECFVPESEIYPSRANTAMTLTWEMRMLDGRGRVWFDNDLVAEDIADAGFESGRWAGGAGGRYGSGSFSGIRDQPTNSWGADTSSLRYYYNQISAWTPSVSTPAIYVGLAGLQTLGAKTFAEIYLGVT